MQWVESRRLILREWLPSDADAVFDMYSRWEVARFLGSTPTVMTDREQADATIVRWRALELPEPLGVWAVTEREGGRLLGTVLLKEIPASSDQQPLPPSGDVEVGWHFHPDAWGHGYATEAAGAVMRRGFDAGLQQIVAVTYPENVASQAVCRRLGMTHHGQTTQYYNMTCELFVATPHEGRTAAERRGD